ncbi:MAG: efflux RND transporter periplasmic adaptor subunit [Desulfovibrionaceae bacterium]
MKGKRMLGALGALALAVIFLWFGGAFVTNTIGPGDAVAPAAAGEPPARTGTARVAAITDWYEAVGTVRPRTETRIEAQVTAKVRQVLVRPGGKVAKGDPLLVLDSRELQSRADQARQALSSSMSARDQARQTIKAAQAAFDQAQSQYKRIKTLFSDGAVTKQEMDKAESDFLQAEAALRRAGDGLSGAESAVGQARNYLEQGQISLGYATIVANEDAEVLQRLVEPGDLAFPGKALLLVQTGGALRLEALVREGLIRRVRPGGRFPVAITALDTPPGEPLEGVIEEVLPSADPLTRTFTVKAALPQAPGLYPGMFGRLLIPLGERQAVMVPAEAVRRVGQLETVGVVAGGAVRTIYVTTGETRGNEVEILSGLSGGETLALGGGDGRAAQ